MLWIIVIGKDIVHHSGENSAVGRKSTAAETALASHVGSALMGREEMRSGAAL